MKSEIILPQPELKTALSGLSKLVGRKFTLPILSCVKVSRQKNGLVSLQATDFDAHATFTLNNPQPGDILEVLVPLEHLNKAYKCSTSSKQDVALICEDNSTKLRYFIGGNPVEQPVNALPLKEWPPVPRIATEHTLLTSGFGETLKQALQCCFENHSRQVLQGACLDASDPKSHYIVSGDGHRLFAANSFTFPLKESVIIPDSKFLANGGLLDIQPCFLVVQPGKKPSDSKHICLQTKQWQFVTREIDGVYPSRYWSARAIAICPSPTLCADLLDLANRPTEHARTEFLCHHYWTGNSTQELTRFNNSSELMCGLPELLLAYLSHYFEPGDDDPETHCLIGVFALRKSLSGCISSDIG